MDKEYISIMCIQLENDNIDQTKDINVGECVIKNFYLEILELWKETNKDNLCT